MALGELVNESLAVTETPEHGVAVKIADPDLADQFDDFLTEHCYVFFEVRFEEPGVRFFFGQAGSVAKVQDLLEKFSNSLGA